MLVEKTIEDFLNEVSSNSPTPGGGSVSALYGALGVALTSMVITLTIGKKGYEEHNNKLEETLKKTKELQKLLLFGVDEDVEAFNCVSDVFTMPKNTDGEKRERQNAMQKALKIASVPPFKVMELSLHTLTIIDDILDKINKNAISDLGVSALSLLTATKSGWLNVLINVSSIKDDDFKNEFIENGQSIVNRVEILANGIYTKIESQFV